MYKKQEKNAPGELWKKRPWWAVEKTPLVSCGKGERFECQKREILLPAKIV